MDPFPQLMVNDGPLEESSSAYYFATGSIESLFVVYTNPAWKMFQTSPGCRQHSFSRIIILPLNCLAINAVNQTSQ